MGVITLINWCVFWHVTVSLNTCTRLNSNLFSRPVKQGSLQNLESPQLLGIVCRLAFLFRKGGKVNFFLCAFSDSNIDTQKLREVIREAKDKCQQLSAERYVPCLLRQDVANKTERNPNISLRARFFYS